MGDYSGAESSEWKELNEGVEFPSVWKKKSQIVTGYKKCDP